MRKHALPAVLLATSLLFASALGCKKGPVALVKKEQKIHQGFGKVIARHEGDCTAQRDAALKYWKKNGPRLREVHEKLGMLDDEDIRKIDEYLSGMSAEDYDKANAGIEAYARFVEECPLEADEVQDYMKSFL